MEPSETATLIPTYPLTTYKSPSVYSKVAILGIAANFIAYMCSIVFSNQTSGDLPKDIGRVMITQPLKPEL